MFSPKPNARIKARSDVFQECMLYAVLIFLIGSTTYLLFLDYQDLSEKARLNRFEETLSPVTLPPVSPQDHLRPYLPKTRPQVAGTGDPALESFDVPDTASESDSMSFHKDGQGRLLAYGSISPGTGKRFRQAVESFHIPIYQVVLHSPGGSVQDALDMARFIRDNKINTEVVKNGYCASSCPLVFSGGIDRIAHESAWIGVHQIYSPTNIFGSIHQGMDRAQRISASCQKLLVDMEVDPTLWIKAMETPKEQLYILTPEELAEFKLATEVIEES